MTWEIDVAAAGEYEATTYYTCRAADAGAAIEISLLDARVQATVSEAHDPPRIGAEADRVSRSESYVKDFRPLRLGVIPLAHARRRLVLRAIRIPGRQVADVRYVTLERRS
jgi:hypothetical protein